MDSEIAQASDTTEHPNSIIKRLELKAKDMALEEGTHIFPPDRTNFMKVLKRERRAKNPKSNLDKLLYSPQFSKTKNKEKFLRFSFNINDESEIMQQCICWSSEKQIEYIKSSPQSFIGL